MNYLFDNFHCLDMRGLCCSGGCFGSSKPIRVAKRVSTPPQIIVTEPKDDLNYSLTRNNYLNNGENLYNNRNSKNGLDNYGLVQSDTDSIASIHYPRKKTINEPRSSTLTRAEQSTLPQRSSTFTLKSSYHPGLTVPVVDSPATDRKFRTATLKSEQNFQPSYPELTVQVVELSCAKKTNYSPKSLLGQRKCQFEKQRLEVRKCDVCFCFNQLTGACKVNNYL